jgi:hypothetical protein
VLIDRGKELRPLFSILVVLSLLVCFQTVRGEGAIGHAGELSIEKRISGRRFPSVFQAWSPAENIKDEDKLTTVARHDLVFSSIGFFGLRWDHEYPGLAKGFKPESIVKAVEKRKELLKKNPHIVILAEIRYRDASRRFLPLEHEWWRCDRDGKLAKGWKEGGYIQLDFSNPGYRNHVVVRARAAMQSGAIDGIMLDWWREDEDRLALLRRIREAVGESALIMVNPNANRVPKSAGLVNGLFMECGGSRAPEHWSKIADTLVWAEKNLRRPHINCVETWYVGSRNDFDLMRVTTALTLTLSDGYCLFSDPNPLPSWDHLHDWYGFWDKSLGRPISSATKRADGAFLREFDRGTVVYNPMGNRVISVSFADDRTSLAGGRRSKDHAVGGGDGDIFLKELKPVRSWDSVNGYRVLLEVDPRGVTRSNSPGSVDIDLAKLLADLGETGKFDEHTIEVMAYDSGGKVRVFDSSRDGYERYLLPWRVQKYYGISKVTLSLVFPDHTCRRYAVYFDTVESGRGKPQRYAGLVGDGDFFVEGYKRREINACQFDAFCDLDNDGDLDLFKGGVEPFVYCYENVGGNRFVDRGRLTSGGELLVFPHFEGNHRSWLAVSFYDWDSDGDQDLFANCTDGPQAMKILYYENTTSSGGQLTFVDRGALFYEGKQGRKALGGAKRVAPTFVDWDGDGRTDILLACDDRLYFHRNLGVDESGVIRLGDGVGVRAGGKDIELYMPCFDCADIDGDGDVDLFAGTKTNPVYFYKNIGTRSRPKLAAGRVVAYGDKVFIRDAYTRATVADFTGDGLLDFVVGRYWERTLIGKERERRDYGWLYENVGTAGRLEFERRDAWHGAPYTERFQHCDAIKQNSVRAVDWNGDDKTDLLAGDTDGFIWYFRNQGGRKFSVFATGEKLITDGRPLCVMDHGGHARLDICDWNNDDKKDLVVADGMGGITLFINKGSKTEPVLKGGRRLHAGGKLIDDDNQSSRSSVLVCDWNNDGRKDVIKANNDGYYFFENMGTDAKPKLAATKTILLWGNPADYTRPNLGEFIDWDGDGVKDFIGCEFENIVYFYKNKGTVRTGAKPRLTKGIPIIKPWTVMMISGAEVVDWNGDGDLDILTGQGHGGSGLRFFERDYIEDNLNNTRPTVKITGAERRCE